MKAKDIDRALAIVGEMHDSLAFNNVGDGRGKMRELAGILHAARPKKSSRPMARIPIKAAREIAESFGYDQVMIYARKVGDHGGEHMTTYGVDKTHCNAMARIARYLQTKILGWTESEAVQGEI